MNQYRSKDWFEFRQNAISVANGKCERCSRGTPDGAVLQVHHKNYVSGRRPWEYKHDECEVLCKGCHAQEHGIVQPQTGWKCVGEDDLGELIGVCEQCGTEIRYVFLIDHPKWRAMEVGINCCDRLTGSTIATDTRRLIEKRKRFVSSVRWRTDSTGTETIVLFGKVIGIVTEDAVCRINANGRVGKIEFQSKIGAKLKIFDLMKSGELRDFLRKPSR